MTDLVRHDLPPLPRGFTVRHATRDDLPQIAAVAAADENAVLGEVITTQADLAADWEYANWLPERDTWVILAPEGEVHGYGWCHTPNAQTDPDGTFWAWPDENAEAVDRHLLSRILERAAAIAAHEHERDAPTIGIWAAQGDEMRRRLFSAAGFARTRVFYLMAIATADLPDPPLWPAGIELRPFRRPDDERAFHAAVEESFAGQFRWFYEPFEEWRGRVFSHPSLDLELWAIARDGDEIAGVVKGQPEGDLGHVDMLAVRKPWRGRGLGLALLVHAFHLLQAHGFATITLGVDAENPTGALDLYERAGMSVRHRFDFYEKPLTRRD